MATPTSSSSSPELFTEDDLAAADALLSLYGHRPIGFFPRWLKKRKRSVPADGEDEEQGESARLSPATPLLFDPNGGDETLPAPTPIPAPPDGEDEERGKSARLSPATPLFFDPNDRDETPPAPPLPPLAPLPPRPKTKAPKNNSNEERCKKLAKEHEQSIAALSARKLNLEQSVVEAKNRCQFLKAKNSWLKELQFQWRLAFMHQQQQLREMSSRPRTLDLFPVGPSSTVAHHHEQQPLPSWQMPCLSWRPAAAAGGAEWLQQQQRAVEYAQARKRRLELQRTKSCPSSSPLPSPNMQRSS